MAKGKWATYSGVKVGGLSGAIRSLLGDYAEEIYQATEEGLDAAAEVLADNLGNASPKKTGKFAKAWKSTGRKYKLVRFVGNTTTVPGSGKTKIALANIFEYSTTRGKPFVKETYESSINAMAAAIVAEIKKEA